MTRNLLFAAILCGSALLHAQDSTEKELELLETPEQIENYLELKNSRDNKLITFNEEKHKTTLAKELFGLSKGGIKTIKTDYDKTVYKVVEKTQTTYYRAAYIYLDGTKYSLTDLNTLRTKIIKEYKSGAPFDFLAQRHSMDENANRGGDLGWFTQGDMYPDFENEIINGNHYINEIFMLDVPDKNWYYVVLKTHQPKDISEIKVLKIVEAID
ncbi:peptidylprolyl isomerase [Mariniflexile sp. AS56]|uniref:peptidylprolyl isomerase n=1 Tax=Mariniflexile sp. AS56 TaxID=3063957 RepID=UPI0026F044D5|nr:peptidylprolyl isomerase [Mariniflexile sp. AS56]MDO7171228.1 peptidylprolyl isomerase [Mariniflexile sp. AS56]